MFGGLELKGSSQDNSKTGQNAFNPALTSSGFSFLRTPAPEADAVAPTQATVPQSSGYSFLSAPRSTTQTAPLNDVTAPSTITDEVEAISSVFEFMKSPSIPSRRSLPLPLAQGQTIMPEHSDLAIETPAAISSGFSFLDVLHPTAPSLGEQAPSSSSISVVSGLSREPSFEHLASSSLETPNSIHGSNTTAPASEITGSGVVFGHGVAAVSAQPKVVKKRNRTARIGVAANSALSPSDTTTTATPSTLTLRPPAHPTTATTSRDSALEASRRAEEFISEKLKTESIKRTSEIHMTRFMPVSSAGSVSSSMGAETVDVDEDSVVAAARAAAEEAQYLHTKAQTGTKPGTKSYFGGLFRSRSSPSAEGLSYSSSHAHVSPGELNSDAQLVTSVACRLQKEHGQLRMIQEAKLRDENPASIPKQTERVGSYSVPEVVTSVPEVSSSVPEASLTALVEPTNHKQASKAPARQQLESVRIPLESSTGIATSPPRTFTRSLPAKPLLPAGRLEEIQTSFRGKVESAMAKVTKLRQHRLGLLQERFVTLAKERLALQSKQQAEASQMAAVEAEDFEAADKMSQRIDAHERERVEISAFLVNIRLALEQLEEQKSQVAIDVIASFSELKMQLNDFLKQHESSESHADAESMKVFAIVAKQLSTENERLLHDLKHLERDTELVAEERRDLEASISEQAGEFQKLRDDCQINLKVVETEIEELQKQLQEKLNEAAKLRTDAAGYEESILKVRVKFSRQLQRIQRKEIAIKDNREEWELEKRTYELNREENESKVREHSEALLSREHLTKSLIEEIEMVTVSEELIAKEVGIGIMADVNVDSKLAQLQTDVVKCEAALEDAQRTMKVSSAALIALEKEMKTLEARLPALEQIKNDAASRRDFKDAAKASKEIKEASARLKECKESLLSEAMEKKTSAESHVGICEKELEQTRSVAQEKEKQQSRTVMLELADNIKRLLSIKMRLCSNPSSCELKPNSVQGVSAYVIDCQIAALHHEGESYGEKYGGWDELVDGIESDLPPSPRSIVVSKPTVDNDELTEYKVTQKGGHNEYEFGSPKSPGQASNEGPTAGPSKEEMYAVYRGLVKRLQDIEAEIELAVNEENFEKAASLDDVLAEIMTELECLSLSDDDMVEALATSSRQGTSTDASLADPPLSEDQTSTCNENFAVKDGVSSPANGDATYRYADSLSLSPAVTNEEIAEIDGDAVPTSNGHIVVTNEVDNKSDMENVNAMLNTLDASNP